MVGMFIRSEFPTNRQAVALTFDDGPNPFYTPQILDIFREAGAPARATFFMIGEQIERYPETAQAVREQGHEIGNHTYTHPYLTRLDDEACRDELVRTHRLIESRTGAAPRTFRPPYIDCDERVAGIAASLGYAIIGAVNGEARDWEQPGVRHIVDATKEQVRPGSVLLFHDGYGDRSQTVEAVRILVPELLAQGYELMTVSELMEQRP
jgi:peptidoglycan/xylan/chitin deacetylase (PgdA/CDA1 family)